MDQDQIIKLVLQQVGFEGLPKSKADVDALAKAFTAMVPAVTQADAAAASAAAAADGEADAIRRMVAEANKADEAFQAEAAASEKAAQAVIAKANAEERAAAAAKAAQTSTYELSVTTNLLGRSIADATRQEYAMADVEEVLNGKSTQVRVGLSAVDLAMEEVAASSGRAAAGVGKMTTAKSAAAVASSNYQQRITGLGYAINDFTSVSGDMSMRLNSIANNMPMLLAGFGGLGLALSGILPVIGLVIKNWDTISGLWDDRRPITGATESVHGLSEALKKNESALDNLREKGTLNLTQMVEFAKLTKEQTELEAKLAAARETEANKKTLDANSNTDAQGRATGVRKAVAQAGGYDDVVQSLVAFEQEFRGTKGDKDEAESLKKSFEELLNKALKGDEAAIKHVTTTTAHGIGKKNYLADMIDQFNPNTQKRQQFEEKQWDDMVKAEVDRMAEEAKADKDAGKDQKALDDNMKKALKFATSMDREAAGNQRADEFEAQIIDLFGSVEAFEAFKGQQKAAKTTQRGEQQDEHKIMSRAQEVANRTHGEIQGDAALMIGAKAMEYQAAGASKVAADQRALRDAFNGSLTLSQHNLDMVEALMAMEQQNRDRLQQMGNQATQQQMRLRTNLPRR